MAGISGCSRRLKELELLGSSSPTRGSVESEYLTTTAIEADPATTSWSCSSAMKESMKETGKSGEDSRNSRRVGEQIERSKAHWSTFADEKGAVKQVEESDNGTAPARKGVQAMTLSSCFVSAVEEQIERSKAHWSELADQSNGVELGDEVAELSNVEEFKALQMHPVWGSFFQTFGYEILGGRFGSMGELVMGKKFAEGGQAELHEVQVKWWDPRNTEIDLKEGCEWVVKVFKKGTFLKYLKSQLPQGYLQFYAEDYENWMSPSLVPLPCYTCLVPRGILLKDGRFAFLMRKEDFDLRNLIEHNMKLRSGKDCGPFSKEEGEYLMYRVALGVDWLHSCDIIHRDLKASNVLVEEYQSGWPKWRCVVADYECSVGVVGTGFFRAPEILKALKDRNVNERPEVFSRAADVYSYGMTCYEILAGKLPFEDHPLSVPLLTDLVINQNLRPEVPEYVVDWTHELLRRCWQSNPTRRHTIGEILNVLSANSAEVRRLENRLRIRFGENFRSKLNLDNEI